MSAPFFTVAWGHVDRAGLPPVSPALDSPRFLTVAWLPLLGTVDYPADPTQAPSVVR